TDVAGLPDVLDLVDVATDEKGLEILFERGLNDQGALRKRRASPPDESWLGRFHLHDDQPDVVRRGQDGLDVADLDRRGSGNRLREPGMEESGWDLRPRGLRQRILCGGEQRGAARHGKGT